MMKMNSKLKLHVGGNLRETSNRVLSDIARFERGETVEEDHLTFENWQALFNVLTPKRYELLQYLHQQPERSVRALARALNRDYKRVHDDVQALVGVGLVTRDSDGLHADYDAIELPPTRIAL